MYLITNFVHCIKHYVDFQGRATRSEFWFFYLATLIINVYALFVRIAMVWTLGIRGLIVGAILDYIVMAFFFLPQLSVSVRRLHDVGKSGWYYLFILIPLVGWVLLLVAFCTDSYPLANEYGENPKNFRVVNRVVVPRTVNVAYQNGVPGMNGIAPQNNGMARTNAPSQTAENLQNRAKIIRVFNEDVSVGMNDGSFFVVNTKEIDFIPFVGDIVFVYTNGEQKIISKTPVEI